MPWQIRYNDRVYRNGDLTIDDCEEIERLLGEDWGKINPLRSAKHAKVVAAFMLHRHGGMDNDAARELIGKMKAAEFLKLVEPEDEDLPTETEHGLP